MSKFVVHGIVCLIPSQIINILHYFKVNLGILKCIANIYANKITDRKSSYFNIFAE